MDKAVLIMCKNEEETIYKTLYSVRNYADVIIVLDTGSTDSTITRIRNFCKKHLIELHLKESPFVDFSTSRNELIAYADLLEDIGYYLLMDANDELVGANELTEFLKTAEESSYNIQQELRSDNDVARFYNLRVIKPNSGWYYKGRVHEGFYNDDPTKLRGILPETIKLFQDRKEDELKTQKRFERDLEVLLEDYNAEKKTLSNIDEFGRTLFYIGQTYMSLAGIEKDKIKMKDYLRKAFDFYYRRGTLKGSTFQEETYFALYQTGHVAEILKENNNPITVWLDAFGVMTRAEPLIRCGQYYYNKKQYQTAFMFANFACRLEKPKLFLFFQTVDYDVIRWKLHALILLQLGEHNEDLFYAGKESITLAIIGAKDNGHIDDNLEEIAKLYAELEEIIKNKKSVETANDNRKTTLYTIDEKDDE